MEEPLTNGSATEPLQNHVENNVNGEKKESNGEKKEHRDKSHSSSSSSHKHSSSSSKHKHKDKDRDREKDKHRSSSSHHKSSHGDKEKHSSSSSKHSSSSSSHKSSHKDKHRDKDKHHSSSSSHKDGEKKHSSSSSSKHSSSDKDRHSSSSKDKHRSSSSHKSSHSDKHRDKDKHKSSSSDKSKSSSGESKPKVAESKPEVKAEPISPSKIKAEPISPRKVKEEPKADMSDDDVPLSARMDASKVKAEKRPIKDEDSDDEPLSARMEKKKVKQEKVEKTKKRKNEDDDDFSPIEKKKKKKEVKKVASVSPVKKGTASPTKKAKKEEGTEERWRWWEEEEKQDGVKWHFLEHKGPVFAPPYEPLPDNVRFYYDGKPMKLSQDAEEVGGFYGRMLDHDYTTRDVFNDNFFKDWRKVMTSKEREIIRDLSKCNFKEIDAYYKLKSEEKKAMSKEEKKAIKEQNEEITKEYGFCTMDGHKEKMGNFKIEPPGLFRGRGEHPKQGMLKRRVMPEDVIINCSKDAKIPVPPEGHKWKEVRHDNLVTWLASWTENVQNQTKYVMLAATSKLKGSKDWKKYEMARSLHTKVDKIRAGYREDLKSKEMRIRQRAVAMYFIDKLALRAGNEKDEDTADTVGCCSLRYEHIKLHEERDGKQFVVEFDFLGKDSIRYHNEVPVDKRVFKNLKMFMENKNDGDDLFDRLNTSILNKHLNTLMEGLTAKVFRTYNASRTLQEQLDLLTEPEDPIPAKILAYNRANRSVAILCNHQRAVPKTFGKQMENLQNKIEAKKEAIMAAKREYKQAKSDHKSLKTEKSRSMAERKKKTVERLEEQLTKLEIQLTDKDENKEIALGTSKLNYLDPRISVAWCKKWEVPIEKVYNKTQREKFAWAIDMADEDYKFTEMD